MCDQCIEWGGKRWHRYSNGYYERTDKSAKPKRTLRLHREVWLDAHGEIPAKHDIHHVNGDKGDNSLGNLECLSHGAHKSHHLVAEPIPRCDWTARPDITLVCVDCKCELIRKRATTNPRCRKCAQVAGDDKRKVKRICQCCGTEFVSRAGNFCSQRCVNVATAGATVRVLPEGRQRA